MINEKVFESFSAEDTFKLGEQISRGAAAGQVYCLDGDLGVGKTVFTKGFAKGLGIAEHVNSPTFTILQIYEGRLPLYHFDVYRIEDEEELYEIGAEDYFYGKGVCLVEWAENVSGMIPADATHVKIEKDLEKGFDYRRITIYETAGC